LIFVIFNIATIKNTKNQYERSDSTFLSHLKNGRQVGSQNGKLWDTGNNYQEIMMNPNIRQYIIANNL
tara:strand:- start:187 stop:390 length:204 start_codon:yes stop_codon:yes gene_type:complete